MTKSINVLGIGCYINGIGDLRDCWHYYQSQEKTKNELSNKEALESCFNQSQKLISSDNLKLNAVIGTLSSITAISGIQTVKNVDAIVVDDAYEAILAGFKLLKDAGIEGEVLLVDTDKDSMSLAILSNREDLARKSSYACLEVIDNTEDLLDQSLVSQATKQSLWELIRLSVSLTTKTYFGVQINSFRPWIVPSSKTRNAYLLNSNQKETVVRLQESTSSIENENLPLDYYQDSELLILNADSKDELLGTGLQLIDVIQNRPNLRLKDLAYTVNCKIYNSTKDGQYKLAIIAQDLNDCLTKLDVALRRIETSSDKIEDQLNGIYFSQEIKDEGKLAFMLPGLGSAYSGMLADLCLQFPVVRTAFETLDQLAFENASVTPPSLNIFPSTTNPVIDGETGDLISQDYSVVAVLLVEYALNKILSDLGITPDAYVGFSTGEYGIYFMNGYARIEDVAYRFYRESIQVAKSIPKDKQSNLVTLNVFTAKEKVKALLAEKEAYIVADLSPVHTIVTGETSAVENFSQRLTTENIVFHKMPAPIPYHTPLVKDILSSKSVMLFSDSSSFAQVSTPSWACSLAGKAPEEKEEINRLAQDLFKKPIRFRETIEDMYRNGITKFIEVGPNSILTSKVKEILVDRPYLTAAANRQGKSGITQLHHLIGLLVTTGLEVKPELLYRARGCRLVEQLFQAQDSNYSIEDVVANFQSCLEELQNKVSQASLEVMAEYDRLAQSQKSECQLIELNHFSAPATLAILADSQLDLLEQLKVHFSDSELEEFKKRFSGIEKKTESTKQWILSRLAAKNAIQHLYEYKLGKNVELANIVVKALEKSNPAAEVTVGDIVSTPQISISHKTGVACALAIHPDYTDLNPGIDLEQFQSLDKSVWELPFDKNEIELLEQSNNREQASFQAWTAKEAAYKAAGGTGVKQYQLVSFSSDNDYLELLQKGSNSKLSVYSQIFGDYIVSFTFAKREMILASR